MISKLREAIEVLHELPQEQAEVIADAIIAFGETNDDLQLTDTQAREIEARLASPTPRYLTIEQLRARLQHFGA